MESLDEPSRMQTNDLQSIFHKLMVESAKTKRKIQSLQERRRKAEEDATAEVRKVSELVMDYRRQLKDLEKKTLREVYKQKEWESFSYNKVIRQLEKEKDELYRTMWHIQELCNQADPLTILSSARCLETSGLSSHMVDSALFYFITPTRTEETCDQPEAEILLDTNTASNHLHISDDMKTALHTFISQNRPESPERFQHRPQVLSSQRFFSGRHYWEVDVGRSDCWRVGLCSPTIDREGGIQSVAGNNEKSWCLFRDNDQYSVIHDRKKLYLDARISSDRVRIYLDYKAGQISFYALCDPIRHLHTFHATLNEPLHVVLGVWRGSVRMSGHYEERNPTQVLLTSGEGK